MTAPVCKTDPASDVIGAFIDALKAVFDPDSPCPPDGGGTKEVRFFAAEGPPPEVWDAHNNGGCKEPFVWVRAVTRFRSKVFPNPVVSTSPCDLPRVLVVEIGVARCSVTGTKVRWADYAREAEISLDDSWRIERALCAAARQLSKVENRQVGTDSITPTGPEGGIYTWSALAYVEF